jgi:7,8-dihydroneopterin aldolase/epimerase/oxygenase
MGKIAIEGMMFYAHHGFYKEEEVLGGKYGVDVYMHADIDLASLQDELGKTINYERIYTLTKLEMEIRSKLIEHLCGRILRAIKLQYPTLGHVLVRVSKYSPPVKGNVERVYVELEG